MQGRAKGFTLIEILVVIAIIAILAAIVFPVMSSSREKARQATCLSNLRQLGTAVRMYADDWDGCFPAARVEEGGDGNPAGNWAGCYHVFGKCDPSRGQIHPYVRNVAIYLCPSARGVRPARIAAPDAFPYPLSYAMNNWLSYRNVDQDPAPTARVGLLIHESPDTIDDGDFFWSGWAGAPEGGHNEPGSIHHGGTCVVFCDAHAKWQSYDSAMQDLKNGDWSPLKP